MMYGVMLNCKDNSSFQKCNILRVLYKTVSDFQHGLPYNKLYTCKQIQTCTYTKALILNHTWI